MGDLKQEEDLRKASSGKIEINQVLNQDNILAKSKNAKTVIKNEISRYATQKEKKMMIIMLKMEMHLLHLMTLTQKMFSWSQI